MAHANHIPQNERYVVKWVNGIWTIFDRVEYKNCKPCLGKKNAERVLKG
jgi:hypothetical protein